MSVRFRFLCYVIVFLPVIAHAQSGCETLACAEQQAIDLIQGGHATDACSLLRPWIGRIGTDVNLWNLLGIAQTESGDYKSARDAFEHGLRLAPRSAELNENLGLLFFRQADYAAAKKFLAIAVNEGSTKPGVLFSFAASKLRTGEPGQALSELRSLEPALSGSSDYWQERGRAELLEDPRNAPISFDHALALAPDSVSVLNEAATAAEKQGLDEKALSYLIRARTLAPKDVSTLVHFGSVCIRLDLGPDARDALTKAYALAPSNNRALYLLARANISLQNWQEAYDLFQRFSRVVPRYAPAYYAMGWLDVRLDRLADARRQLEHALALDPELWGARYELSELDCNDGRWDEAEKSLRMLLANNPHDAKANLTLGDIMMRKGKLEEAEIFLERAIAQDPGLAAAHYKLSMLSFRRHDNERGEREKDIAAKLNAEALQASKTQLKLVLPDSVNQ